MKRGVSVPACIVLVLLAALLTFQITYVTLVSKYQSTLSDAALSTTTYEKLDYVDSVCRQYYVGEIDEDKLQDYLIRGYLVGLGDKYASYMTAETYSDYRDEMEGGTVGVGIHVIYNADYSALEIISVTRNSPAEEAGVQSGDLIFKVGDEYVSELGYEPAVDKMLGDEGTVAVFTVWRGGYYGEEVSFQIVRAQVEDTTVDGRLYDGNIGIVRISGFADNTGESFKEVVEDLISQGATSFVFDVRYNSGGALTGILETLDYLLPEGPIVRITDKAGNEKVYSSDADCLDQSIPMCVLVNGSTCSAAELFTAALKDYQRATIIGTQTYGKGTVLSSITLPDGSGINLSTALYNPPYSDNFEGIGVEPDIVLDLDDELKTKNFYSIKDDEDNQLQRAVEVLRGEQ